MSRPPGRPRLDNPRNHDLDIRLTADEHAAITAAAAKAGVTPSAWARDKLMAAAKRTR